jgi:hypothetical protein
MKELFISYILIAVGFTSLFCQPCLPEGITFTTQEQIDNFQINYPDCSVIEGSVTIFGDDITNLDGLFVLTKIQGNLEIEYTTNLTNLYGLSNISDISGNLDIFDNQFIQNLSGLDGLELLQGDLNISSNDNLINFVGLSNLSIIQGSFTIVGNDNLINLQGLNNLSQIEGGLFITYNDTINDLTGLENVHSIGEVFILSNYQLINLNGLSNVSSIEYGITLGGNWSLLDISALNNLNDLQGFIGISLNYSLTSLMGLGNINPATISSLTITNNSLLETCEVNSICEFLVSPGGNIIIQNNAPGCNSVEEVSQACLEVDIPEPKKDRAISITPNPAKHEITVQNIQHAKTIEIYNVWGARVLSFPEIENVDQTINIQSLNPGIYTIIISGNSQNEIFKFVKN